MSYDPAVIREIIRIGNKRNMGREAILGALATGIVESNLTNLSGGDADSVNWRQERASIYGGDMSIPNSVNRFYNEWEQHDKPGFNPGLTAANVQRPAAQYRGRYSEEMDKAKSILEGKDVSSGGGSGGGESAGSTPATVVPTASKPNPFSTIGALSANQQGPYADTMNRGWQLLGQMWDKKYGQQAATPTAPVGAAPGGGAAAPVGTGGKGGLGGLKEAFYDPVGGWKNGQSIGAIGGHDDHDHFGGGPKTVARIVALAQSPEWKNRLTVREYGPVDKVDPVHVKGSYHYRYGNKGAADISGSGQEDFFKEILRRAQWK